MNQIATDLVLNKALKDAKEKRLLKNDHIKLDENDLEN